MAKGQMRSNREKKKPKTSTKQKDKKASTAPMTSMPFPTKSNPPGKGK